MTQSDPDDQIRNREELNKTEDTNLEIKEVEEEEVEEEEEDATSSTLMMPMMTLKDPSPVWKCAN